MKFPSIVKNSILASALIVSVSLFQSCKDKVEESAETVEAVNTVEQNKAALQSVDPNTAAGQVAEGLNPAHGQPGHRCDISVGAPLNTPAGGNTSTTPVQTQSATPIKMETTTNSGALNPAHGQPGHRCDITVGAPLPSN